jgi:hypothetical protein
MKQRINLTLSLDVLHTVTELSGLTGKTKSDIIDELMQQTLPILKVSTEIIRKSKHLDYLGKQNLRQDSSIALEQAEMMQSKLHNVLYDLDVKINRKLRQTMKKASPVSNTGVAK